MRRQAGFAPIGIFFFVIGVGLLGSLFRTDVPLLVKGVRTTALIESVERSRRNSGYVAVAFKVGDYESVRTRIHVSEYSDYSVGRKVEIVYLPSDPGSAVIPTFKELAVTWLMKILFGGTALAMALVDFLPSRKRKKEGA